MKTGVQGFPSASIPTRFMPKHANPTVVTVCATPRARSSLRSFNRVHIAHKSVGVQALGYKPRTCTNTHTNRNIHIHTHKHTLRSIHTCIRVGYACVAQHNSRNTCEARRCVPRLILLPGHVHTPRTIAAGGCMNSRQRTYVVRTGATRWKPRQGFVTIDVPESSDDCLLFRHR